MGLLPLLLLPSFLFLIPLAAPTVSASGSAAAPAPGQPLPPGTVTSQTTGNVTAKPCPAPSAFGEPLVPEASWSLSLVIPEVLFDGTPTGSYTTQAYSVSRNGTFTVSDGSGNAFTVSPIGGLPSGVKATTLVGNSTEAIQSLSIGSAASVTVTYSVAHKFCQPSGVKLTIQGTVNWPNKAGVVSLPFKANPIKTETNRAWFGNNSGTWLGFDWSDSAALAPSFSSSPAAVSWSVGTTFSIDPVTVASVTGTPLPNGNQGRVCSTAGLYWLFYYNAGISKWAYRTSSDGGNAWSSETALSVTSSGSSGASFFCSGATLYYASTTGTASFYYRYGTLQSNGALSWKISETSYNTGSDHYNLPSIAVSSTGNFFVALLNSAGSHIRAWEGTSCSPSCTWALSRSILTTSGQGGTLVPLTAGKMGLVFVDSGALEVEFYDGTSGWGNAATGRGGITFSSSGFTATGDTIEAAAEMLGYGQYYLSVAYSMTPSWSTATQLNNVATTCYVSVASDGGADLVVYLAHGTKVQYYTSSNAGSTWSGVALLSSSETSAANIAAAPLFSGLSGFAWQSGSSSPYNIRFAALPITIPTAALSGDPWSRPGVSPYESYFAHFTEYVSPGNGLLSIGLGTALVPGRGLDLRADLVYSMPYAWSSSGSVYQYDNFTLASIGAGWALNVPWMGTNYLHLADGQAFPYAWAGSTFEYHGATDFTLVNNLGSSYTLTMRDGTVFQFNANKQLTSETDRTGNNTLTFSYSSGRLSSITDTFYRSITFGYDSNNRLSTIISAGRTWTLAYSSTTPSQLTSVTDPLSRVTTYQYAGTTGANLWLVNAVLYPTGGKTTYTFGSGPLGTEATSRYVTARNTYSSSTQLTRSDGISYTTDNGQVTWSNMTYSDGLSTQGYLRTHFISASGAQSYQLIYDADASNAVFKVTGSYFSNQGRINQTKVLSPSMTLLSSTTTAYDNWGNANYTKDALGQQTWFSYSNTQDSNLFKTSSCATSGFYSQTIKAAIHNVLLGKCDFQNGAGTAQQESFYKYDKRGDVLETKVSHNSGWLYTDHTYDLYGNTLTTTDANGYTTYFRYSSTYSSAYLTKQSILVGTQNVTTTFTYDSAKGFLLSEADPNGQTTSYQYDVLGRLTLVTYPAIGGVSATKQYSYDDTNSILTTTDENGNVAKQYFDGLARQTKVERWNGSSVYSTTTYAYNWLDSEASMMTAAGNTYTYSYDSTGRETKVTNPDTTYRTISYDDVNNLVTNTDENGHQTVNAYDWNQRLVSVKQYNSSTTYYLTTYSYDLSGNLLTQTDAKSQATSFAYDDLNRLTTTTFPDTKTESRTYDGVGNILTRTTANGSQISYAYDALNRLTSTTYPGSGGTVTYTYDPASNRLSLVSPSASDYSAFDARDRVTNATEYVGGAKYSTLYAYDKVGNVLTTTYPDSYSLSMTYDAANRLKVLGSFATLSYTLDDKVSKITYGDGEVQTYNYDSRDRPTRILDKAGGTTYLDLNYTYGATSNVATIDGQTYSYDWLDRLTQATGFGSTITYAYDQVGNLVKTVAGSNTTNFTYGSYNRLSSWGGISYSYDANGNRITKTGGWTYSYDYENRLTKALYSGTTVQQNSYDGAGNLVKSVETDTKVFSYQGLNTLYEKDTTTGTVTKHFYAGGMQVAKMVGVTNYYMHPDALGSTRLVMTSTLTVQFSSDYKPYGLTYSMTGVESFKYTGKMSDSVTGLYYFGARWYDPAVGRFITQDSYSGSQNDPQSLNRYVYARDNPMKYVDPNGHMFYADADGGAVKVSIVSGIITTAFTSASTSTTAVSSGRSTTYITTTTSTTITCVGGYCTTSTSNSYTTWTTMTSPGEMGPGGAQSSDGGLTITAQLGQNSFTYAGNLVGAYALSAGLIALTLEYFSNLELQAAVAITNPALAASIDLGLASADGAVVTYMADHLTDATPEGVLYAFERGFGTGFTFSLLAQL